MIVRTDSPDSTTAASSPQAVEEFEQDTQTRLEAWKQRLQKDPDALGEIEQEIDGHFRRGGGLLVASLLAEVTATPEMAEHAQQIRDQSAIPLRAPQPRPLQVRLLCGLVLWITTGYCAPRANKNGKGQPIEQRVGLYPELAALGFGKGCSPALQYTVARIVALSPSIEAARKELGRQGISLDKKAVRRIAEQLGYQLLALRQRELLAWRCGQLFPSEEFAGCRIAVQIDGGRVRLREYKKSQGKRKGKGKRRRFDTPWREPKALIIFEFDQQGKMIKKHRQPLIDGTLQGPDHLAELVAFHLHRLGAAKAELVVFISDGARWIWDRLPWIERRAGLDSSKTEHVLDYCHAAHHISLALHALGLRAAARHRLYGRLKKLLRRSRYDEVVSELTKRAKRRKLKADHQVWTEIRYLQNHGKSGHLRYQTFRRRGIPCGSGAIESAIRRVINLRLKSNAIYWLEENAEAMFAIRALLLCDRWEDTLKRMRHTMARDRRSDWRWTAPDLASLNTAENVSPPSPQTQEQQVPNATAA